jgi:peptidoglycan/LPS O-acetylase OafA/YrhL
VPRRIEHAREFVTLDGMRGVAALAVVAVHTPLLFGSLALHYEAPCILDRASVCQGLVGPLYEGGLAVNFFFALSGFVLAYAYEDKMRRGMPAMRFMLSRLIRLYPLYLVGLTLGVILAFRQAMHGERILSEVVSTLGFGILFLPTPPNLSFNHYVPFLYPLNVPAWSLFFELAANAVYALMGRHLTTRMLILLVLCAAAILVADSVHGLGGPFEWSSIGSGATQALFSFFAGVLVYRIWLESPYRPELPTGLFPAVLLISFAIIVPDSVRPGYQLGLVLVAFPLFIYAAACNNPKGPLRAVYSSLGGASYAIYAIHLPVFHLVERGWIHWTGREMPLVEPLWGIAFLIAIFLIALFLDRVYDIPIRIWLSRRLAG